MVEADSEELVQEAAATVADVIRRHLGEPDALPSEKSW
jgi:hypothetical protein